tara:strand:- start:181 stop:414 length:234 start_codon:yes stop_codon:yes gene_type:complete
MTEQPDMDNVQSKLMDMIIADESPSNISDTIKDMLFAKAADKVDTARPDVANSILNTDVDAADVDAADTDEVSTGEE